MLTKAVPLDRFTPKTAVTKPVVNGKSQGPKRKEESKTKNATDV